MFGRLGVRGKILAVVAVPILVLLIAAGAVTFAAARTWDSARNTAQLLTVADEAASLAAALQDERDISVNFVDSFTQSDLGRARTAAGVDSDYLALRSKVAAVSGPQGAEARSSLARVDEALGLKLEKNPDTGVTTVVSVTDLAVEEYTGIYTLRAITFTNRPGDWPLFPTEQEAATREGDYAAIGRTLLAISGTATSAGGVQEAVADLYASVEEEALEAGFAAVPGTLVDDVQSAQTATDAAFVGFEDAVAQVSNRSENSTFIAVLTSELRGLEGLDSQRTKVRDRAEAARAATDWYATVIEPLVTFPAVLANDLAERPLARSLAGTAAVGQLINAIRVEGIQSEQIIRSGRFASRNELAIITNGQVRTDVALENAQVAAAEALGQATLPSFGASFDPIARSSFTSVRFDLATGEDTLLLAIRSEGVWATYVQHEQDRSYIPAQAELWNQAVDQSDADVRDALLQTLFTAVAAALVVLASLSIALLIARRIVRPLRRLTTTATAVRQELPRLVERVALPGQSVDVSEVQIPVESADEVGRLAEAFNAVNAATLAIAGEQAALRGSISEMFVNVARRDQVLLNRQLASIDEMERTQDDPETLMRLFALDHLATRMRRNSESLLVLAGIDSGRRMRRPMPLSDVIRTASSEIELYERVELVLDADPSMVGHSALTAGHLFAELLENATVFSDPDTKVMVHTSEKDGSFVVEISDEGIGMTPEELRQANARVVSSAASEILGAQRLGLFVVGRIARRVGARVEIESEEGKGTKAIVTLPRSLFDTSADGDHTTTQTVSTTDDELRVPSALISHSGDEEVDDYSANVTSRAITGNREKSPETEAATDDVGELIEADVASAPASDEVDLAALTAGTTASGLPTRRQRGKSTNGAGQPETTTILGLPERPTTGQLDELDRQQEVEDESGAPVTERRTAIFRSFRARGADAEAPSTEIPALAEGDQGGAPEENETAIPEPESVGEVPTLEPVAEPAPEPVAELVVEPAPEPEPEPEAASVPGLTFEPVVDAGVALDAEVTDNDNADKVARADDLSGLNRDVPSMVEDGPASDAEPSDAKAEDEEGPMAPDWSLGQDPAISNGFGHGDTFRGGDGSVDGAVDEPVAIPGLEPATDDAAGSESSSAGIPATDFGAGDFPELVTPSEAPSNEDVGSPAGSVFPPVQGGDAASENLDALLGSGKAPAADTKKRRGLFGRRRKGEEAPAAAPTAEESPFEAVTASPIEAPAPEAYEAPAPEAYEAPAPEAYEAPAPEAYEAPAPEAYEAPAPEAYEAPAPEAYGAPAEGYETPAPAYEEPSASPFGDWTVAPALPSEVEVAPTDAMPEALEVDPVAYAEPQAYAVPDLTEPEAPAEPFEVNYDVASYGTPSNPDFAEADAGSLEIPTIASAPVAYGRGLDEAEAPGGQEVYADPPQLEEAAVAPYELATEDQPAWEAFAAETQPTEGAVPSLESLPEPAPAPPPQDFAQYAEPPAYPAAEAYGAGDVYGVPGPSSEQFAQPYGWEAAGADALEAANYEPDYRGYSPEAFSAPPPTEDYEADVATAVFTELQSLSSERPTIQRTKAGLTRREPSAVATAAPADADSKAVERDPETVRANFAGFYTGTTRGRADAAAQPTDVPGSLDNEVTP